MFWKRTILAFLATGSLSVPVGIAQEIPSAGRTGESSLAEFGRASGGEVEALIKQPSRFSGSFGFTTSRSSDGFFPGGNGRSYGATLGGTLLKDRAWFFGVAETSGGLPFDRSLSSLPTRNVRPLAFGTMQAQLGDRESLVASHSRGSSPLSLLPSSFLSLHYTGVVSSNMFFTGSASQQSVRQQPGFITLRP